MPLIAGGDAPLEERVSAVAWLFPGGCESLYRAEVAVLLTDLGIVEEPDPSADLGGGKHP